MLPLVRQARYLGRYRQIAQVLGHHGFGYALEQMGLFNLLSLPRRVVLRIPPSRPVSVAERLCQALVELGPTFIKLGQLLSTRPDLIPADLIAELNKLQDTVPPFPSEDAVATIETELGRPIYQLFRHFERTPLAAASLGQVHTAVLHSGEYVVVKVQRPDIASIIHTDLAIITDLAALAQERTTVGKEYDLVELAWEFSAMMRDEINYLREASNAERFRRNFAHNTHIHIPLVYNNYTTSRVLTTERLYGIKINDVTKLDAVRLDRKRVAYNSLTLIIEEVFQHGFFHADPHPGNLFALPGEVIGVVDFGQAVNLDRDTTRQLLLLLLALINHDNDGAIRAMYRMGMLSKHNISQALRRDLQRFMDRYIDRPLSEVSFRETGDELMAMSHRHGARMPSQIAMLIKTLVMAEGIGLQIDPQLDVFRIAEPHARQALAEQFSPGFVAGQVKGTVRDLSETMLALPEQLGSVLQQLDEGKLVVQTHEEDLRRVSGALIGAANRLAVALVLVALILGMAMLSIAVSLGQWSGTWLVIIFIAGGVGIVITALVLGFALMRGRNG